MKNISNRKVANKLKLYVLLFGFLNLYSHLSAQQIIVEFLTGTNHTKLLYDWDASLIDEEGIRTGVYNFGIGISAQVNKYLYLKTEIGTNNILQRTDIKYQVDGFPDFKGAIRGNLEIAQNYIEVLPEFRLNNIIFLNAGFGLVARTTSKIGSSKNYFNGTFGSFAVNLGVNPYYKNLGFLGSIGYKHVTKKISTDFTPGLSLNQLHLQFGVTYHFLNLSNQ